MRQIDNHVRAGNPALVSPDDLGPEANPKAAPKVETPKEELAREARAKAQEEKVARWRQIVDAGGEEKWVESQIVAKGLRVEGDPTKLTGKEKESWKDRKKAETDARKELKKLAWGAYHATHILHLGAGIHWEENPDPDKFDVTDRDQRLKASGLPDIAGADDLAKQMGLTISRMRWMAYHREVDSGTHYRRWQIPKRDGSARTITAPKKELKAAQRWALRNIFEKLPVHGAAHGFLPDRSVVSNAVPHAGAHTVLKLDVKEFFPTITWKRVKGMLRKAGLREQAATLLALLVTESPRQAVEFRGKTLFVATGPRALPQGSPASPAISNAICMRLDRRVSALAKKFGCVYTRYADDLTFSWHGKQEDGDDDSGYASKGYGHGYGQGSAQDKKEPRPRAPIGAILHGVAEIVLSEGFVLNEEKTRIMRADDRQRVTGLVVNKPPKGVKVPAARVPRTTLRQLRAAVHNLEKGTKPKHEDTLDQLKGMAAFVYMTDKKKGGDFLKRLAVIESKGTA